MRAAERRLFIFLLIISAALLTTAIFIKQEGMLKKLSLSPDIYEINPPGAAVGEAPEMSKEDVKNISKTLSGIYENAEEKESVAGEYIYSVSPGYFNVEKARKLDDYTISPSVGKGPNGEDVVYGEAILIIDKRTIAISDAKTERYWIGKKKGDPLDLGIIKAFLPVEKADSAGDDFAAESEPETSESIVQNRN